MRKSLVCVLFLLVVTTTSCDWKQQSVIQPSPELYKTTRWDGIVTNGELKIGVNTLDPSFDNDLIDEFSKESKLKVTKVLVDKDSKEQAINSGEVDFLWSQIPDSSENSMIYLLSSPYFHCLILRVVKNKFNSEDWRTIGVIENSVECEIVQKGKKEVKQFSDVQELISALENDIVDVIYINSQTYNSFEKSGLTVLDDFESKLVLAFKHNDNDVKNEVEKIMVKIKANETASKISEKWYNKDFIIK